MRLGQPTFTENELTYISDLCLEELEAIDRLDNKEGCIGRIRALRSILKKIAGAK